MSRFKSTLCIALLTLTVSSTAFGGTIVGARASRSGNIVGARTGNIAGTRTGNIAGTSVGVLTEGSRSRFDFSVFFSTNMGVVLRMLVGSSLF